jgi:hypothetical protein
MKYMMLIYSDESIWTEDERAKCMAESVALCHDLNTQGQYVSASPLHYVNTATSVRVRDGKALITDGPFAETREQLGGYYIVDVANLDEALEVASRIPGARMGTVEVRPIFELDNLPIITK